LLFMKNIFISFILIINNNLTAQTISSMQGEYYLRGVMETASGFKLNADSSFQFFYSYGALDRYGSGTWKQINRTIIFNSRAQPEKDFALIKSEKSPGSFLTVRIIDKNELILRYVDVIFKTTNTLIEKSADNKGIVQIPVQQFDNIGLMFRLCPDRYSIFVVQNKEHNYFEFKLEPWIAEVFFKDFSLELENKNLKGKHPLLRGESFVYEK
jgi:hypothetical protein